MSKDIASEPAGSDAGVEDRVRPEPEVAERAQRRTFTAKYKLAIVEEYERAERCDRGAILRREDLYSSLIVEWRRQRDRGALEALSARRGPKPSVGADGGGRVGAGEVARLKAELETARRVIRIQGELSALLEGLSSSSVEIGESGPWA